MLLMILAECGSYWMLRGWREASYFASSVLISIGDCRSPSAIGKNSFQRTGPGMHGPKRKGLKLLHPTNTRGARRTVLEMEEKPTMNEINDNEYFRKTRFRMECQEMQTYRNFQQLHALNLMPLFTLHFCLGESIHFFLRIGRGTKTHSLET